jgi:virginiamycin B lyase
MRWRAGRTTWVAAVVLCCLLVGPAVGRAAPGPTDPTEVAALGGGVGPLTLGPGGALWFAAGEKLGRIDGDGKLTEVPLSESVGFLQGIAAGQEGNLWATRESEVDRITPAGEVTRFPLPDGNEKAGPIAVAPDGTLWFTVWASKALKESSFGEAYVISMRPGGSMTRYLLPGSARRRDEPPASIVASPDGDVWFTDPAFNQVGRITPDTKLTEFSVRLHPEVLATDDAGGVWFVGLGGLGKVDATGQVQELRTGLAIGSAYGAVAGPEGDLWFIGGATRVMRLTPSGQLSVVRGPGASAASHIALGPGGSVWISTVSNPIKGVTGAPLLRYEPGLPGVEIQPGMVTPRNGQVQVGLSCGGSTSDCAGEAGITLGRKNTISTAYRLAANSEGAVTLTLSARNRHLLAQSGYVRVAAYVSADGGYGDFTELVLRSPHPPPPRPGRPLVMPLPEDIRVGGLAWGPDRALWTGGDIGRFTRITPDGHVSTVDIPTLDAEPSPIGFDPRGSLWFLKYGDGFYNQAEPVLGRLAPDGKLTQVQLPAGPRPEGQAAVDADGKVWVVRSEYPHPGEIDRVGAGGKVSRFPVGVEPGAIVTDRRGAWFAESGPRIGHITPSGEMRVFPVPHKGFINGMTLGRHGDVWFTHWNRRHLSPAIGHITPDGRVTERTVRHLGSPWSILAAPDGNLWFTTEFPRRIVRMTPHGKLKVWRRGAAAAGAIALGPEGNIWFGAGDQDTLAAFRP